MTAHVPVELTPKRRGLHRLDRHQISTSFPFGFIKRAIIAHQKDSILVYPALAEVDPKLLTLCRSSDKSGATMRPRNALRGCMGTRSVFASSEVNLKVSGQVRS